MPSIYERMNRLFAGDTPEKDIKTAFDYLSGIMAE